MKRKFTKLMAALALLVFMTPSMVAWGQYTKATSIAAGDVVLLVTEDASNELKEISTTSTKYGIGQEYDETPTGAYLLTVVEGSSDGTFAFQNVDGEYLYWTSGNSLATNVDLSDNTSWNVEFDDDGNAEITNAADGARQIWWNVSSPRFACYTGKSAGNSYYNVQLFKEETSSTTDPTITFNDGSVNVGKTLDLNTLFESNSSGTVTYEITEGGSYATLEGSTLTGVDEGSVTVEASQEPAGSYNAGVATATITVNPAATLSSIAITTPPTKTTYTVGELFDATGMVVTATYSDNSTDNVTASCTWTPNGALTISDEEIVVSYTEGDVTKTAIQTIIVNTYTQPTEFEIGLNNTLFGTSYNGPVSGITNETPIVGAKDNVTVTYAGSGNHYVNDSQIRFYPNNKLTFDAPLGYEIQEIVFTAASNTWAATISANEGSYDSETKTWTGSATSVIFTGSGSSRCDMQKAAITLAAQGNTVAAPTFSPAAGTYTETQSVTISCETQGASIYYTTDGSTPDNTSTQYNGAITVSETTTINAIAYVGADASSVASATYTIVNLEHAGTEADPYTVADARAAIDANVGVTGVYATGIISQVDSYSSQYNSITYWISADGTTTSDQLEVYSGKGLNNTNFTSIDGVEVGATVVIFGDLKKFNQTYEFDKNNYLTSYTAPTHAVEAPTFTPIAGTYTEAQSVTISCETPDVTIYYTTDGTEPDNTKTQYTTALAISTTTTIKAIAYDGTNYSNVTTATYHFCSAQDPYTVTEALAFLEYPANGIYVEGIVSTAPTQAPTNNGELTYYISVDGQASNELEVYKGKGLEQAAFTAQDDIQVGDIVTIYGNVQVYNNTIEFASGNYLVSFERPQIIEPNTITAGNLSHVSIGELWDDEMNDINLGDDVEVGTMVFFSLTVDENYTLQSVSVMDANNTAVQVTESEGIWSFTMSNSSVTINATATESSVTPVTGDKYVKVTSTTDLADGQYLIVYENGGLAFDGSLETLDAASNTISVAINNNEIAVTTTTAASEFTIAAITDGYSIKSASGYYIGQTTNANGMNSSTTQEYENTISIDEAGNADVVASGGAYLRYNATSGQERFRYFKSSTYTAQKAIQLYKKVETTPTPETYTLTITGYTDDNAKTGYYLIASPVTVDPEDVGMTTGDFDLYEYDDTQEKEWLNWKGDQDLGYEGHFNLVPGKGYLYAKKATTENPTYSFTLTGTPYTGEGEIEIAAGWNLVGNPFGVEAEISSNYYALNQTSEELIATSADNNVAAMQGVFVYSENASTVIMLPANTGTNTGNDKLSLNVGRNGSLVDRAIVRFGEGQQLPKFQLNPNNTKVYIPQGNQDFAIVRSAAEAEMPVSFKASENGTYTLAVDAENVEMNYLHLIDNMTGMDVDLLATPSYSFEAKTTDYASRFKLVFKAGTGIDENTTTASFAFFNGDSWTVSNQGEATLQVIDMMGRVLSSKTVNGNATINVNETAGVYMLRLINGNSVKVQKVVVK